MTINQPSQTELSKCHDREKRSFTQLKSGNTTRRLWIKFTSFFQNENLLARNKNQKNIYLRKTDSYSRADKAGIIWISYMRTLLSVEKFTAF